METLKQELKENIIEQLNLEDIAIEDINGRWLRFRLN